MNTNKCYHITIKRNGVNTCAKTFSMNSIDSALIEFAIFVMAKLRQRDQEYMYLDDSNSFHRLPKFFTQSGVYELKSKKLVFPIARCTEPNKIEEQYTFNAITYKLIHEKN